MLTIQLLVAQANDEQVTFPVKSMVGSWKLEDISYYGDELIRASVDYDLTTDSRLHKM